MAPVALSVSRNATVSTTSLEKCQQISFVDTLITFLVSQSSVLHRSRARNRCEVFDGVSICTFWRSALIEMVIASALKRLRRCSGETRHFNLLLNIWALQNRNMTGEPIGSNRRRFQIFIFDENQRGAASACSQCTTGPGKAETLKFSIFFFFCESWLDVSVIVIVDDSASKCNLRFFSKV